jgi:competence protein ComEA
MSRHLLPLVALMVLLSAHARPVAAQDRTSSKPPATTAVVINLNSAGPAEFEALPGIGAKTAARIIEYRQKNGPFKKIEELMNVPGIGEKNFLKLKPQLTVASSSSSSRAEASNAR